MSTSDNSSNAVETDSSDSKLKLYGFNNLSKSLNFNIYDICYAVSEEDRRDYIAYIDETYNADRLTQILTDVVVIIGAHVLNVSRQDYDPHGASVTMLICEDQIPPDVDETLEQPGPLPDTIVAHLDKSHVTVHTYPESHPENGISTFRLDIDVSTCGLISPLRALNYLIHSFDSDIVTADYRVRGFTRDVNGVKHYIDHEINSIQNYMSDDTLETYHMIDVNVYQENIFHTKMIRRDFNIEHYLFGKAAKEMSESEKSSVADRVDKEMHEIFYGRNYESGKW